MSAGLNFDLPSPRYNLYINVIQLYIRKQAKQISLKWHYYSMRPACPCKEHKGQVEPAVDVIKSGWCI